MNLVRHTFTPLQHLLAALAIFAMIMAPMAQVFAEVEVPPSEPSVGDVVTPDAPVVEDADGDDGDGEEGEEEEGAEEGSVFEMVGQLILAPLGDFGGKKKDDPARSVDIDSIEVTKCGEQSITVTGTAHLHTEKKGSTAHLVVKSDGSEALHQSIDGKDTHEDRDWSFTKTYGVGTHTILAFNKLDWSHIYATDEETFEIVACDDVDDTDDDGIPDDKDNCPLVANANQADRDGDGIGDVCDNCVSTANVNQEDTDGDGVGNACDNCANVSNPNQADTNQDGIGDVCDGVNPDCDDDVATIVAHKIVCTDEADLPNYGAGVGGPDITGTTASSWVASHPGCNLEAGWSFEWALDSVDTDPGDTLVGPAGAPWTTFGPTNGNGEATLTLTKDQLGKDSKVWFREVLQDGYIPFTHGATQDNSNNVTAEFYCNNDVLNYDNYDWVSGIKAKENKTYHCVAWNSPKTGTITIVKDVDGEASDWSFDFSGALEGFTLTDEEPSKTFSGLTFGEYAINEVVADGYSLANVSCDDEDSLVEGEDDLVVSLDAGEDVTCTFVNTKTPVVIDECPIEKSLIVNGSFESEVVTNAALWQKFSSVTGWLVEKRSDAVATTLEHHKGWSGNVAAHSTQYTELDGDEPTRIEQAVTTEPGATYKLFWAFAPRQSTSASENNLSIEVEGSQVDTEGPAAGIGVLAANSWTHGSYQFVAGDASTEIAFKDLGPEAVGSGADVGTFLDDVRLCKIKDYVPPEPEKCTVTLTSGAENTTVTEKDDAFAQILSFVHPAWTAAISGAQWIWGDNPVAAPVVGVEQTFVRNFGWGGTSVTSATLYVAADNSYSSTMNGDASGTDANVMNFTPATQDSYDVTSLIDNGNNALSIKVLNTAGASDPAGNPAGLMYKLVIEGTGTNCDIPYNDPQDPTYTITGFKWNDADKDGIYDEGESKLPGWTITATDNDDTSEPATYSDVTNADGYYSIVVPAGSWIVNETQQSGWTQSAPATPGTCSFTFGEPVPARVAKVAYDTVVNNVCNFGNYQNSNDDGDDEDLSCTLTSNKASVSSGETFTLSWTTDYATDVTITGLSGELALDGSQDTSTTGDTTYTLTATRYVNDAPEQVICSVGVDVTSSSHHHSSGSRKKSSTGTVLGDSTERPETAVLGASTAMPVGAPDTGAGGTSPVSVSVPTLLAVLGSRASVRKTN